jgi:mono/diheme cytochrome c family protein
MRVTLRTLRTACTLLAASLAVTGCAVGGSDLDQPPDEPIDEAKARQLFQTTCRSCHSLADARAAGVFGPDLDLLQPDAQVVRRAIDDGPGPMPQDLLTGADADLVARYVAQVAGAGLEREGEGGARGGAKPQADG